MTTLMKTCVGASFPPRVNKPSYRAPAAPGPPTIYPSNPQKPSLAPLQLRFLLRTVYVVTCAKWLCVQWVMRNFLMQKLNYGGCRHAEKRTHVNERARTTWHAVYCTVHEYIYLFIYLWWIDTRCSGDSKSARSHHCLPFDGLGRTSDRTRALRDAAARLVPPREWAAHHCVRRRRRVHETRVARARQLPWCTTSRGTHPSYLFLLRMIHDPLGLLRTDSNNSLYFVKLKAVFMNLMQFQTVYIRVRFGPIQMVFVKLFLINFSWCIENTCFES